MLGQRTSSNHKHGRGRKLVLKSATPSRSCFIPGGSQEITIVVLYGYRQKGGQWN